MGKIFSHQIKNRVEKNEIKVAFIEEVNKSQSRKLLTHLELSLSEKIREQHVLKIFSPSLSVSLCLLILLFFFH